MTAALNEKAVADVVASLGVLPESFWETGDDACDCSFQRIGMWTNPYTAETLEVRMCCLWEELYKLFPQYVRRTEAFLDYNAGEWVTEPREWDGDHEMPRHLWYRQLARRGGRSLPDVRKTWAATRPPQAVEKPKAPPTEDIDIIGVLFEMVNGLAEEVAGLQRRLEAGNA